MAPNTLSAPAAAPPPGSPPPLGVQACPTMAAPPPSPPSPPGYPDSMAAAAPAISLVADLAPAPATAPPSALLLQALSPSHGTRCCADDMASRPKLSGIQKQVLALYRGFLRTARLKAPEERRRIESVILAEFRDNARSVDRRNFVHIEYLLRRGKKQLEQLKNPDITGLATLVSSNICMWKYEGFLISLLKQQEKKEDKSDKTEDEKRGCDLYIVKDHLDVVNAILDTDDSCIRIVRKNGKTSLHTAARIGYHRIVKALIERDPGIVPIKDRKGQTALHMAVKGKNTDVVEELLMADVSILNSPGTKSGNKIWEHKNLGTKSAFGYQSLLLPYHSLSISLSIR
ncbi:Ankyrin repeat-containing protein [Zea mays]|uniref:Ankyrin repeat-containing protein n=1 Tax=Zea mays TaxID=4577 RepID=A0A3L6E409_MAIZE|nr:Ankyrin repeat-containing protein [Zea mays]